MSTSTGVLGAALVGAICVGAAQADLLVQVTVTGFVEYNQVNSGNFAGQGAGSAVELSFLLDPNNFVDSAAFPTRGYVIDQSSFSLTVGTATVGLQSPFPAGQTPYFVLRDNDPAVDGFFLSTNVDFPFGVPTDEPGGISPFFVSNFSVTYGGATLSSLDILDAVGTYDFTGLSVFNFTVSDGSFDPIGILFEQMTITKIPAPATLALLAGFGIARTRRRN